MKKIICIAFAALSLLSLASCQTDEPHNSASETEQTARSNISKPRFDKDLTTTDTDGFSIRSRFKTGGDAAGNLSATVHWRAYASKPKTKPGKSDMNKHESMRMYGSPTIIKSGSKRGQTESVVFDRSHAGYGSGTYIYYYVECSNSKGTAESSVCYHIVKR